MHKLTTRTPHYFPYIAKSVGWCRFILRWCLFVCWNSLTFGCSQGHRSVPVLTILVSLGVLRHENGGWSQSLTLFLLNTGLALLGSSAGFSIGHAENIVCLNTAVEATVPRNGVAELLSLVLGILNTVEYAEGVFIWFLSLNITTLSVLETNCSRSVSLLNHVVWGVNSVELVNSRRRNGLHRYKVSKLWKIFGDCYNSRTRDLPSYRYPLGGLLRQSEQ